MTVWTTYQCSCLIRFLLTILLSICFAAHIQKELFKFFDAKTTTSTSVKESEAITMPAMAICAEQVLNTSYPGSSTSFLTLITLSNCKAEDAAVKSFSDKYNPVNLNLKLNYPLFRFMNGSNYLSLYLSTIIA